MKLTTTMPGVLRRLRRGPGFSLAETSMAVAIAALGLVSILGLMPQGLETARRTGNIAAESRIMQNIISDLQSADWNLLPGMDNSQRRYDDQGIPLASQGDTGLMSYLAQINLNNDFMPGSNTANAANGEPYLRRLVVKIASTTNPSYSFPSNESGRYKTTSFVLSKIQ